MSAPDTVLIAIIAGDTEASRLTPDDMLNTPEFDIQSECLQQKPSFNAVLTRYKQYVADMKAVVARQQSLERSLYGESITKDADVPCISDIANRAVQLLVRRARSEFAPSGTELDIEVLHVLEATDQGEWEEQFRDRRWRKANPDAMPEIDLDRIWAYLEGTYGGESGRLAGLRKQAKLIAKEFSLDEGEMRRTSSYVCCSLRVWSEKKDYGAGNGKYEVSYHSQARLHPIFQALSCFAEWAELDTLSIAVHPRRHSLADYSEYFDLRSKHSFPGLDVVRYKSKWDFQFSLEVAEKLMLFLGEYAGDA